jgi:hypothetical protein
VARSHFWYSPLVMGLDQYAERRDSNGESCEISYWRKHNALQGWMEKLWTLKLEKPAGEFNCKELRIDCRGSQKSSVSRRSWKPASNARFLFRC